MAPPIYAVVDGVSFSTQLFGPRRVVLWENGNEWSELERLETDQLYFEGSKITETASQFLSDTSYTIHRSDRGIEVRRLE